MPGAVFFAAVAAVRRRGAVPSGQPPVPVKEGRSKRGLNGRKVFFVNRLAPEMLEP